MFKLIEHTADMGIEARAPSRATVAEQMALGLVSMMFAESPAIATVNKDILLQAENSVELLVAWLNEIVYWCEKDDLVPAKVIVTRIEENELHATLSGEKFDPQRHVVERQVKSVTYHQACFEETEYGWYARVFVDL